jgi:hypothetical protein
MLMPEGLKIGPSSIAKAVDSGARIGKRRY